ncbi:MAG: SRPBCC domain-containing protein [Bacteroidota bacterium]|nr:SRPBCC domain-containing protein [Bacteroidota bacterium]
MQNFDWTQFTKRIAIKASVQTLYDAWTQSAELEKWFLKTADFIDENGKILEKQGAAGADMSYEWTWYLYDETERGAVLIANGKDHFRFTFAGQCYVDVTFSEQYDHTVVELTQTNIPTDDKSKLDIRLGCSSGWSFYFVNLKSIYEGGLDLRSKDERLRPMVNN